MAEKFDYMPVYKRIIIFTLLIFMPKMLRYLNVSFLYLKSTDELVRMLQAAKAERNKSNTR